MKKNSLILLSLLLGLGLASCNGNTPSPSSSSSESTTEATSSATTEENPSTTEENPSTTDATSELPEWVDYAHNGSVRLSLDYKDRDFFEDGVEQVSLYNTIDGDTAHFKNGAGETIKCRFFGIDTPESTGKIQPYGGKASKYTSGLLEAAQKSGTIVVSSAQSDYGKPNPDSTGSRYVSLIWVNLEKKNAPLDELYLLNLMVVQEGLSWVKNVGDMPEYTDAFYAAEEQAKAYKLMLHSGLPDDEMPTGDYENVTLLDLKNAFIEEIAAHKAGDTSYVNPFDNKKVRIQGTVNGFANHIIYLADFCYYLDNEGNPIDDSAMVVGVNGEYASINVFAGMSVPPSKFTTLGNYIEVCGIAKDSKFGFQITSVDLPISPYSDHDSRLILKADANTEEHALHVFDYTADELQHVIDTEDYNALNCRVHMTTPVECTKSYKGDSGDITLYFARPYGFRCYFTFKFKPYPVTDPAVTWSDETLFVGHKFTIKGCFVYHEAASGNTSMQICPSISADLILAD